MRLPLTFTALMLGAATPALSQSVQGVWKLSEVVISGGANSGHHTTDVQPGLLIFTKRHYSLVTVDGFTARPEWSNSNPTPEELAKVWTPFTANAGTYEIKDSTLSCTPSVAKNPSVMAGTPITARFRIKADSVWFTFPGSDNSETRAKWVRVERS